MSIRRAIPVVLADDIDAIDAFYGDFLGFETAMHEDGFRMFRSPDVETTQVIAGTRGGGISDAKIRDIQMSVEVSDVDAAHAEAVRRGLEVVYPLTDEPWGVRRFFVKDPGGTIVNVAGHIK